MWRYLWRYKGYLLLNLLSAFGFILIELGLPTLLARIIDIGFLQQDFAYVVRTGLLMLLCALVGLVGLIAQAYSVSRVTSNIVRDIRGDIFAKTMGFSHYEYEQFGASSLITSTTNDAYQIMLFLQTAMRTGLVAPLMFIASIGMIWIQGGSIALIVLIAIPLLLVGVLLIGRASEPLSQEQQTSLDSINLSMRESLSGLRVIRAFCNEDNQQERFAKVNERYAQISRRLFQLMAIALPAFSLIFTGMMATVLWLGAAGVADSTLQVGTLAAFIEYLFHALFSFLMFAIVFVMYPRASVSAKRLEKILATQPSVDDNWNGATQSESSGYIEFDRVTFAYPDNAGEPVLKDVSFTAEPGQTVAFIGSTGSGKSTLIQLIPRFYDVTGGRVLVDGVDVRDYRLPSLRDKIGFIPQKALLFTGTIAENLRFGKPEATRKEIEEAADIAQAAAFISAKEDGFEEHLAEGGANMSGGQKQRLSIARALVKRPPIYIFDDSFSALDYQTDTKLRARLKKEISGATVLIVAQRVSTIRHADKIVVLSEGQVVAQGTHQRLLRDCPLYYEIAASQLSKEELN